MAAGRRPKRSPKRAQDSFGRRAQKEGYPARSVYKLEEIDRRVQLFRRGARVLDLGAAPGSWTLYAAEQVGREGKVRGLDIQPPRTALPPQASIEVLDVMTLTAADLGGPGSFELVISDMAPATSGQTHRDQFLSFELYMRALEIAQMVLVPGGKFVGKIFQGQEFPDAKRATQLAFDKARIIKPEATRSESYEVFLIGLGLKARAPGATPEPDSDTDSDSDVTPTS